MNRGYRGLALAGMIGCVYLFSGCGRDAREDVSVPVGVRGERAESRQLTEYHCGTFSEGRFELNVTRKDKLYNSSLEFIDDEHKQRAYLEARGKVPIYGDGKFDISGIEYFINGKSFKKFERGKITDEDDEDGVFRSVVFKEGEGAKAMEFLFGPQWEKVLNHVRDCEGVDPCRIPSRGEEVRKYEAKRVFSGKVSGGSSALDAPVGGD